MNEVLTANEVAEFLRTDIQTITQFLESGEIAGFRVKNEWRVLTTALIKFLGDKTHQEQLRVLIRELNDPKSWACELRKDSQLESEIRTTDFSDNTMGAFLKRGLAELDEEERGDNIVDIRSSKRKLAL